MNWQPYHWKLIKSLQIDLESIQYQSKFQEAVLNKLSIKKNLYEDYNIYMEMQVLKIVKTILKKTKWKDIMN